jgi:hypothetical protein
MTNRDVKFYGEQNYRQINRRIYFVFCVVTEIYIQILNVPTNRIPICLVKHGRQSNKKKNHMIRLCTKIEERQSILHSSNPKDCPR